MITPSFTPFPVIHTDRLILRKPEARDAEGLYGMRSDPEVMQYIPRPLATCVADVEALIAMLNEFVDKNERINWLIEWKETGEAIGLAGYVNIKPDHHRAEVGYSLHRAWHRKGIMREALRAITDYGFEVMNLNTIEAIIDEQNEASGKLLEDAGYRKEAHFIEDFQHNGVYRNSIHYGLLRSEWYAPEVREKAPANATTPLSVAGLSPF
jgi:ribosomal-protein-alanine N-acetyltransferase